MQGAESRNTIGHWSVLTGLWFINILILMFGFPFLIYKKLQEFCTATGKNSRHETKPESARYFPCRIDS